MATFRMTVGAGALGVALASAAGVAQAAEPLKLGCDGPILRDATKASLAKLYWGKAVTDEDVDGVEGETLKATVINAADPASRIEIFWRDEAKKARPSEIRFGEGSTAVVGGLTVGMDIKAVEALNGKPFSLNGFGWDMGGNAVDWKGGALGKTVNGCTVTVQFSPAENASEKAVDKVQGDRVFSSADKAMRAASPVVQSIAYGWGDK